MLFLDRMNLRLFSLLCCFRYVSCVCDITCVILCVSSFGGVKICALLDEDGPSTYDFCLHSRSTTFCNVGSFPNFDAIFAICLPASKIILTDCTFLHIDRILSDEVLRILQLLHFTNLCAHSFSWLTINAASPITSCNIRDCFILADRLDYCLSTQDSCWCLELFAIKITWDAYRTSSLVAFVADVAILP